MNTARQVRVTVITATYNFGDLIADALRSVECQTMQDWECIIIDDASKDDTSHVVREFTARDERFLYLRMEQNAGVSAARNRGLSRARGTYIQLLDADDVLAPEKLERQVAFMEANPDISVVYSDFIHFDQAPDLSKPGEYAPSEKISGNGDTVIARLLKGNIFRPVTVLFRATVLSTTGLFREQLRYVEDLDLWFRIAAAGNGFHYMDDPACRSGVRVNPRGLSKDLPRMQSNLLPVLQNLWNTGGFSISVRIELLLRYVDYFLESLVMQHRFPAFTSTLGTMLPFLVLMLAIIILPFWLLTRPFRNR